MFLQIDDNLFIISILKVDSAKENASIVYRIQDPYLHFDVPFNCAKADPPIVLGMKLAIEDNVRVGQVVVGKKTCVHIHFDYQFGSHKRGTSD